MPRSRRRAAESVTIDGVSVDQKFGVNQMLGRLDGTRARGIRPDRRKLTICEIAVRGQLRGGRTLMLEVVRKTAH